MSHRKFPPQQGTCLPHRTTPMKVRKVRFVGYISCDSEKETTINLLQLINNKNSQ